MQVNELGQLPHILSGFRRICKKKKIKAKRSHLVAPSQPPPPASIRCPYALPPATTSSPTGQPRMEQQEQNPRGAEGGWSYAQFVTANPTAARTLESLLQYSGFFAPVRCNIPGASITPRGKTCRVTGEP